MSEDLLPLAESIIRMRARAFELRATTDAVAHHAADVIEAHATKAAEALIARVDQVDEVGPEWTSR
ncbi:hypothetical protein [Amycolatopsis thailandensis]|uniref:hypothetical protein n=1 Tax=Amycolatopsis thailandensis TaxID=589330 RepID=UPI003638B060